MSLIPAYQTPIEQTCSIINNTPSPIEQRLMANQYTPLPKANTATVQQIKVSPTVPTYNTPMYDSSIKNASSSFSGVKVNATGIDGYNEESANDLLKKSQNQQNIANWSKIGSAVSDVYNAYQYVKNVKNTKVQYENQKKIIDANIANQETMMMENLQENMAQLNVMTAAQNVDLSSEGIQAVKDKGLADLGKDIRDMREQGALNKKALDLDYALNLKNARSQFTDSVIAGGFNIGSSFFNYMG